MIALSRHHGPLRYVLAALFLVFAVGAAGSQTFTDSFVGIGSNTKHPIQIAANELEVRDKERLAILTGNVTVRQDKAVLTTHRLKVHYNKTASGGRQEFSKLEADGKVVVTSGDQTASGDSAVFDMQAELLVVIGNVVLSKGPNVIKGERLEVNLKTGKSRMHGSSRVQMLIQPNSGKKKKK